MITIDASFWSSVGVVSSDGNANGNQYDFYNSILMSNGTTVYNQKEFFKNSPVNSVYYDDQYDWYRAIGVFYSEPIYDQYSFYQNVTFDGVNKVGNQKDFFKFILGIRNFTTLDGTADYYTIPTVTLTGDLVIEYEFSSTNTGSNVVLGLSSASNNFIMNFPSQVNIRISSYSTQLFSVPNIHDGKLHKVKITKISNNVRVYVNDVESSTGAVSLTGNFTLDIIGKASYGDFTNGVISDVKITDGTDLVRYYKIDEDLSATSTIIDSGSDGSNGTAVSITSSELFTLEGCSWVGSTKTIVIAGCTP